ncbi:hypothetical protein MCOR25_011067 [Pyricularia grisea]|nr:hypothetical protein MCOR25_011067 [Pyricularia grisea]
MRRYPSMTRAPYMGLSRRPPGHHCPKSNHPSEAALCQPASTQPGQEVESESHECEPTPRSGLEPEIVPEPAPEPAPQPENPIQENDWNPTGHCHGSHDCQGDIDPFDE